MLALLALVVLARQTTFIPLGPFVRDDAVNPLFQANPRATFSDPILNKPVAWQSTAAFNPGSCVYHNELCVLMRSEDDSGEGIGGKTSRIGLAESVDGLDFKMRPAPVMFPAHDDQETNEWPGGCEDPRVAVTRDGLYVMAYTQWNRKIPRLAIATSEDLVHWHKYGPAFRNAFGGKFAEIPTKSASIVTEIVDGRQTIARVKGKYWMYWGEQGVNAATSDDLNSWTPVVDENGDLRPVIKPRPHFFDSDLTECGPPAVITDQGIVLLYNGKNSAGANGDPNYNANSYCAGQLLISKDSPMEAIGRLDKPFFAPTEPYEKSGQYASGTVFVEGLSYFHKKWFLYYGCADSRVAVAVYSPRAGIVWRGGKAGRSCWRGRGGNHRCLARGEPRCKRETARKELAHRNQNLNLGRRQVQHHARWADRRLAPRVSV